MRGGALPFREAVEYGVQITRGLAAAHEKGIVHRDLKPENLFLTRDGFVKILDFGLAKVTHAEPVGSSVATASQAAGTEPGTVMGTVGYMSPEQVRGQAVDHRSDIFSFGVVLYEMLGGRHPFEAATPADTAAAILTDDPPTLTGLDPAPPSVLLDTLARCLEKQPRQRYQSAEELRQDLGGSVAAEAEPAPGELAVPAYLTAGAEEPPEDAAFVAREEELQRLRSALDEAVSGHGHVVFVTGDPGTGKTALVNELATQAQARHPELLVASGKCNAHTGIGDPYLPFREVLGLLTGDVEARWAAGAIARDHAVRLWQSLPIAVRALVDTGTDLIDTFVPGEALLSRAKSTDVGGQPDWLVKLRRVVEHRASLPAPPNPQQADLFEQYNRVLQALARERPVLLILDDLQWADAGSIDLLFHLGRRIPGRRVLIVGIYRPADVAVGRGGERHPLEGVVHELKRDFGQIEVELGEAGTRELVDALLDTEPNRLSQDFRRTLYAQTGGHPLFAVELLRGMQEQGALVHDDAGRWIEGENLDWLTLPARVEAVIGERVGRLPEELKKVLTVAAVEGETFTAEVLARVQTADEREMVGVLSADLDRRHRLVTARDIRRLDDRRLSLYRFRHILFQRYLYDHLDAAERAYLHEDVAAALETLYGERTGAIAVHLARHYEQAGRAEKEIKYLRQAGENAIRLSANQEAADHFRKALERLATLPDSPGRASQELQLQTNLTVAVYATSGFAAPELRHAAERVRELCEQVEDTSALSPALAHLGSYYSMSGNHTKALEVCRQSMRLAESSGDPLQMAISNWMPGVTRLYLGEFLEAHRQIEQMIAYYDQHQPRNLGYLFGLDPGVACLGWDAHALWYLGFPDQALERVQKAYSLALETGHTTSVALALTTLRPWLHLNCREVERAQQPLHEGVQLSRTKALPFLLAVGTFFQGYCQAHRGRGNEGLAQMERSCATIQAIGATGAGTPRSAHLAEACAMAGQPEKAMDSLAQGLAHVEERGERYWEAELHRLKGELLLSQGESHSGAETSFEKAIEVARRQQAKSWELRATMSLARLWKKQGKKEDARQRLAEIYGWFTEGFDTADLKDAKALLGDLSRPQA
jgi:predicted ATPase